MPFDKLKAIGEKRIFRVAISREGGLETPYLETCLERMLQATQANGGRHMGLPLRYGREGEATSPLQFGT